MSTNTSGDLKGYDLVAKLEEWQDDVNNMMELLRPYKEGRTDRTRDIAVAMTKLQEARMWLAEAALDEPR